MNIQNLLKSQTTKMGFVFSLEIHVKNNFYYYELINTNKYFLDNQLAEIEKYDELEIRPDYRHWVGNHAFGRFLEVLNA